MRTILYGADPSTQPTVAHSGGGGPQSEWAPYALDIPYDMPIIFADPAQPVVAAHDAHDAYSQHQTQHHHHIVDPYHSYLPQSEPQQDDDPQKIDESSPDPPSAVDQVLSHSPTITLDSVPKPPAKKQAPPEVDPFAAGYLCQVLGNEKWSVFSARLFERRLGGSKSGRQKKTASNTDGDPLASGSKEETSASLIDFLCKAEAVKEVLRTYVPHPYNPHKTLTHPFAQAPTGRVTLSRSTVLALSGWSNTQFSYWARRSEAIGVLAYHDRRLKNIALTFHARLSGHKVKDEVGATEGITGKGLDAIIEDVKERTGASPFIRGKHSCLDPFTIADAPPVLEAPQSAQDEAESSTSAAVQQWTQPNLGADYSNFGPAIYGVDGANALSYYMPGPGPMPFTGPSNTSFALSAASFNPGQPTLSGQAQLPSGETNQSPPAKKRGRKKGAAAAAKAKLAEIAAEGNEGDPETGETLEDESAPAPTTKAGKRKRKNGAASEGAARKKAKRQESVESL